MPQCYVSRMTIAEYSPRLVTGKTAASFEHPWRIVTIEYRPAGKNIKATHKAHLRRPPCQQNVEPAIRIGTNKDYG
jgi:hypothetical protein